MPALIPVDNTLGALFIGTILSSILYGVTWLQVYYYYNDHCSRDRWPLKSFVAVLMLVDTANLVFVIYDPYLVVITNFGDYEPILFKEVSCSTFSWAHEATLTQKGLASTRIGSIISSGRGFSIPANSDLRRLADSTRFWDCLWNTHDLVRCFEVLCDVLITVGMVYYLLSNRTQVRRINNVLNLLAIYFINCECFRSLVSPWYCSLSPPTSICQPLTPRTKIATSRDTLIYTPSLFIMVRLSLCAFMAILNSRDYLRETLDGPEGAVTPTQLKVRTATTVACGAQDTAEAIANKAAIPKNHPPLSVPSDTSSSDSVTAFEKGTQQPCS
ncbi:hypothetical protein EDB89DRAFT_1910489 [Lactarius sanguifluus]|nr:hypothetical protein EDB89DRAFT_1910489 [Lactarius sanguifluus]